jgi:diadenosine tetraphosphate (Ap4A) HIT family hydrolase
MTYDPNNIFAKILRGEIPCKKVYEDAFALAFHDIAPNAPTHLLIVPKADYENYDSFIAGASEAQIVGFFRAVRLVAEQAGAKHYRIITNNGEGAGQTVHHFHVHILSGKKMHKLLAEE